MVAAKTAPATAPWAIAIERPRPQRPFAGLSGYGSQANSGQREREAAGRDRGEHADAEGE